MGYLWQAPFMVMYNEHFQEPELIQSVLLQEKLMRSHMKDPKSGLPYHAWDERKRSHGRITILGVHQSSGVVRLDGMALHS